MNEVHQNMFVFLFQTSDMEVESYEGIDIILAESYC